MFVRVPHRIRSLARSLMARLGYDVLATSSRDNIPRRRARLLEKYEVDIVLDVGAAHGGYARSLRRLGYKGRLACFEPLASSLRELEAWARTDPFVAVYPCALGNVEGHAPLQIAGNRDSSSLREMLPAHMQAAPYATPVGYESVEVKRLEGLFEAVCVSAKRPFLKIDTQGFEIEVLRGAGERLAEIVGVQAELSLIPLYADQTLWMEVIEFLAAHGLHLCSLEPGFCDDRTGRLLQVDGVFFRTA